MAPGFCRAFFLSFPSFTHQPNWKLQGLPCPSWARGGRLPLPSYSLPVPPSLLPHTWASDAEAMGASSKLANIRSSGAPRSLEMIPRT